MIFFKKFFKKISLFFSSKEFLLFWGLFLSFFAFLILSKFFKIGFFWILLSFLIFSFLLTIVSWNSFFKRRRTLLEKIYWTQIIEFLVDPVIAYDKDFYIVVFNKAAEKFFSLGKEEVLGKKISPQKVNDSRWQFLCQIIFPSLAPAVRMEGKFKNFEIFKIIFDDPYRELKVYFGKISDKKEGTLGFVKVIQDLTRQKLLLREKSEFLNIAAHNLNTPVSEIKWGLESLEKMLPDSVSPQVKKLVLKIKNISSNLTEIIDDLLNAVRIEKGKFGYQFKKVELNQLVEEEKEKWVRIAERYQVKIYFHSRKKEIFVFCDPGRIKIVLDNLIENALIYNVKNGEIYLKIEIVSGKPFALVSVKDTGIGIPQEEQEKIFKKFFRARNALKYKTEGIGLGLYIVKNIVERHGGKIWFDSVENRGTTFYFTLPLKRELIPPKESIVI